MSDINITKQLLPYQVPHLYQMYEAFQETQCVLDGSDTGTGKTYVALALCNLLKLKPFVVCPKSVISSWVEVAEKMKIEIVGLSNYEKLKGGKYYTPNFEITECPYVDKLIAGEEEKKIKPTKSDKSSSKCDSTQLELMRKELKDKYDKSKICSDESKLESNDKGNKTTSTVLGKRKKEKKDYVFQFPHDTLIIVDEAHKCKNYKTGNSTMLLALKDSNRKMLLLSATITDKIDCFRPFGVVFGFYDSIKKYKMWLRSKLKPKKDMQKKLMKLNKEKLKEKPKKETQNATDDIEILKIIHSSVYPKNGSRMKIKELGDLFPQNQIVARCYYSEDHTQVDEIYGLINNALQDISTKEKRSEALGEIIRCRMRLEMLKLPIILDLVDEGLENNKSVAIFVNFRDSMDYLQHHLKEDCSLIHGGQTLEERVFNIEQFQKNKNKIIIVIIQAGGVGISLHDLYGRARMSLISPSWNGIDLQQCLGRIHRAGSKSPALQRIVYIAKSYEEEICQMITEKLGVISSINDNNLIPHKLDKEKLKLIGDMDKINCSVELNEEMNETYSNTKENEDTQSKLKNSKKKTKSVKRKKYTIIIEDDSDGKESKVKKGYNIDNNGNDDDGWAILPDKYKIKK